MDNYTLMCSKLTELQEEWNIWHSKGYKIFYNNNIHLVLTVIDMGPEAPGLETYNITKEKLDAVDTDNIIVYTPSTDDLIAMLEEKEWTIMHYWDYSPREDKDCWEYFVKTDNTLKDKICYGLTLKEAMLKLLAFEKWGKTWDEKTCEWREG